MSGLKALEYKVINKGKIIKSWEKLHEWSIQIEKTVHIIGFLTFRWSKLRKILCDDSVIFTDSKKTSEFSHSFYLSSHLLTVTEESDRVELYANGLSFMILYKRHTPSFIQFEADEIKIENPFVLKAFTEYSQKTKEPKDWEFKAKNFRLVQREIPAGTLREKTGIKVNNHKVECSSFSVGHSEISPEPRKKSKNSVASSAKRRKIEKKSVNFFLV